MHANARFGQRSLVSADSSFAKLALAVSRSRELNSIGKTSASQASTSLASIGRVSGSARVARQRLLALDVRGSNPIASLVVGWRSRSALQAAQGPVLLRKRAHSQPYRRVLIATDFSQQSLAAARAALELAPDAQFVAAHAFGVADEGLMFDLGVSRKIINAYRRKAREVASQRLSEFVQALGTEVEVGRAVLYGTPRRIIPHYAANIGADLVALGHTPRTGLRSLLWPGLGQCLARMELDLLQCAPYSRSRPERQLLPAATQEKTV